MDNALCYCTTHTIILCGVVLMRMSRYEDSEITFSIRCLRSLRENAEAVAKDRGQTLSEWIRRAMQEKLDREINPQTEVLTAEELEEVIARILEEKLAVKRWDNAKK